jgi:heme/copper-type cytochrome/quinol oxidase subunit 3
MSQPKTNVARKVAGVLTTVVIGSAFFFAIIGVFGLFVAIGGLALAILTAAVIIGRAPEERDLS